MKPQLFAIFASYTISLIVGGVWCVFSPDNISSYIVPFLLFQGFIWGPMILEAFLVYVAIPFWCSNEMQNSLLHVLSLTYVNPKNRAHYIVNLSLLDAFNEEDYDE